MGYQIIASDLDGTLFDSNGNLSEVNLQAIKQLYEMGIYFVPTTGRAFDEMPAVLRDCPYIRYYINSDGGCLYDKYEDTCYETPMPQQVSQMVFDNLFSCPTIMSVHTDTGSYTDADTHAPEVYRRYHCGDAFINLVMQVNVPRSNFKEHFYNHEAVQMICVYFQNMEDRNRCKQLFENDSRLLVAQSDPYNLEIFSSDAGKGNTLLYLADMLEIDHSDTIAMGDGHNDCTMLQAAGLGLAMANGAEVVKQTADRVICSNDEHGVDYVLKHIIKGE